MKRVLFLVNHDVVIYNFRLEIVEKLLEEGYEVYVSSPYGERIENLIELGCKYTETTISRHGTNVIEDFKLFLHYKKILKNIRPDIVLTFTIKPNIYGGMACRFLKIPYIANITGLGTAVENKGIIQKITVLLYKVAFKKIKCVFFQNEENKQFFKKQKIALGRQRLIPGSGVNLERFPLLEYPSEEIIRFVFISRIMKEKGIEQYLKVAEYIKKKYPDTEFHICGFCEEAYEGKLKKYEEKGISIYHGMVRNIVDILKEIHCTIHPTYYPEGMSNVLLESAACGRPIITTNRSGCRETVDEGINGYLIEQQNIEELLLKTEKFINLKHKTKKMMGIQGRKKVKKYFDRQVIVGAYIEQINKGK